MTEEEANKARIDSKKFSILQEFIDNCNLIEGFDIYTITVKLFSKADSISFYPDKEFKEDFEYIMKKYKNRCIVRQREI